MHLKGVWKKPKLFQLYSNSLVTHKPDRSAASLLSPSVLILLRNNHLFLFHLSPLLGRTRISESLIVICICFSLLR